jgi:pimeloyl-ACP methyl ester carboxylesterase
VDEGQGDPIVFVHGVPTWSYNFRNLILRFRRTHRCVAMDHLGFGLSDKPSPWLNEPADLARHVETLVDGLDLRRITLVVHDWGGPLGLAYALRRPSNVTRLVLLNTWLWPARGDRRAQLAAWLLASPVYTALERYAAITPRLFTRLAIARREAVPAETFRHFMAPFAERRDREGLVGLVRAIRHSDGWVGSLWDLREVIRGIPALILWGMKDPAFPPRYLERWLEVFENAEAHRIEGVGHYPHEETPELVANTIARFLT